MVSLPLITVFSWLPIITVLSQLTNREHSKHAGGDRFYSKLKNTSIFENVTSTQRKTEDVIVKLVKWFRSKGGLFSNKIQISPLNMENNESSFAMFATSPIRKGEELLMIPAKAIITAGPGVRDYENEDMCDTARNLFKEYHLKSESEYEPYVKYMFESFSYKNNPSGWSMKGKMLFFTIIGKELPPQHFGESLFWSSCNIEDDDYDEVLHEAAWSIVVSRSWNELLIPIYDMVNHRNGHWHNIDQANSAHSGKNISIIALRDIDVGEQLHISYNECHDLDCEGIAHTYVLPEILSDYGFVEQYPRRFNFNVLNQDLIFELDVKKNNDNIDEVKLTWLSNLPNIHELNWLNSHHKRLLNLEDVISQRVIDLPSHEKSIIEEYYHVLRTAFELAIENSIPEAYSTENCKDNGSENCTGDHNYDYLEENLDTLDYNTILCSDQENSDFHEKQTIELVDSHYQQIEFSLSQHKKNEISNTCLHLSGWLQTCTSFRPHYHEVLVHYPATYLETVKRVLYLGGGDNMILHEILKYTDLELVIGMELDQQVVRSSFKNLGTQPHFDKDIVQWWFGDASKSIRMLPMKYFGTFDLVLVDLQTFVVNSMMVTDDLTIMETAMLLLKPDGIIVQNEDFISRHKVDFAQYTVDLEFHEIPDICQQSLNMGSEMIDFLRVKPKDHNIDTLIFESAVDGEHDFDGWWNYHRNLHRPARTCNESDLENEKKVSLRNTQTNSNGVIIILEVEDVAISLDSTSMNIAISRALEKAGLTNLSGLTILSFAPETFLIALQEGYVTFKVWPKYNYYAFDIMLWSNFDKQEIVETELIAAIGGQSSSSYRIVTGGMLGVDNSYETQLQNESNMNCKGADYTDSVTTIEQSHLDVILREMSALVKKADSSAIGVLCVHDEHLCKSLEALKIKDNSNGINVVPIWACEFENSQVLSQNMYSCEIELLQHLKESVVSARKLSGFVIDLEVPRSIGQILYKILRDPTLRKTILTEQYVILAPSLNLTESWRKNFLDRFRTEIVKFSPAYVTEIVFGSAIDNVRIGIFSSGDKIFYSNLINAVENTEEATGLKSEIEKVKDGILNYIPDFEPFIVTNEDYDYRYSYDQWKTQKPLGLQTIFQFEFQAPQTPIFRGEKVLVNAEFNVWTGLWYPAKVTKYNSDDGTYEVTYNHEKRKNIVTRNLIRKWEAEQESVLMVGERVLIKGGNDIWFQGAVLNRLEGNNYKVQSFLHDGYSFVVNRKILIRQLEPITTNTVTQISTSIMKEVLESTLLVSKELISTYSYPGDGFIMLGNWKQGRVIVLWDGGNHIDLNLFTYNDDRNIGNLFQKILILNFPSLNLVSRDEFPRGFGRVVNFERDLKTSPYWVSTIEWEDELEDEWKDEWEE